MNYVDDKDRKILDLLENNSKLTTNQLSKKTAIPITTIHNRIKKLEKDLQTTQAENEYLSRKITDANTINNLSLASKELGLVKTDKLDYIMTTEEVFVAK